MVLEQTAAFPSGPDRQPTGEASNTQMGLVIQSQTAPNAVVSSSLFLLLGLKFKFLCRDFTVSWGNHNNIALSAYPKPFAGKLCQ